MAASMFIELWNNRRQSMIRCRVGHVFCFMTIDDVEV